jgi:transposase
MNQLNPQPQILDRLAKIEETLGLLVREKTVKDFYTIAEVAAILEKATFTVRQWANEGRIIGVKSQCGRGRSREWRISHAELTRIRNHGLLPRQRQIDTAG